MHTGSCMCGTVRFEFDGEIRRFHHCHCRTCRKAHATVYGSSALVDETKFQISSGEESISQYESSPGKIRYFCKNCGTHVFARCDRDANCVILRLGTLDGDLSIKAIGHIWVSHKPDWYEITDDLPQSPEW